MKTNDKEQPVRLLPCFPWNFPQSYFSLRDSENNEVGFIKELKDLDDESKSAIQRSLQESLFCFEVLDVLSVEEDFELRLWKVQTAQGARSFQTKLTDWPRPLPHGGYVIQDVQGDLFVLKNPKTLSRAGQKQFMAFLD